MGEIKNHFGEITKMVGIGKFVTMPRNLPTAENIKAIERKEQKWLKKDETR